MESEAVDTHSHEAKKTTRTYSKLSLAVPHSFTDIRSPLGNGHLLGTDLVSTRVDEQLISILRHSEDRRKCLEPSDVMDLIAVCLLQFGPREDSLSKVVQRN